MRPGQHSARESVTKSIVLIMMIVVFLGGLCYALYPAATGISSSTVRAMTL